MNIEIEGKWNFGATFIDNEGKNVIGCIYLMNITGARDTDHPPFSNFKIYIRFTYFMFYLVKVSPIARVTSITKKSENSMD
jgi:hypothetical protein